MQATINWQVRQGTRLVDAQEVGEVIVRLGMLFVGGVRRCNLRRYLAVDPVCDGHVFDCRFVGGELCRLTCSCDKDTQEFARIFSQLTVSAAGATLQEKSVLNLQGLRTLAGLPLDERMIAIDAAIREVNLEKTLEERSRSPRERRLARHLSGEEAATQTPAPRRKLTRHLSAETPRRPTRELRRTPTLSSVTPHRVQATSSSSTARPSGGVPGGAAEQDVQKSDETPRQVPNQTSVLKSSAVPSPDHWAQALPPFQAPRSETASVASSAASSKGSSIAAPVGQSTGGKHEIVSLLEASRCSRAFQTSSATASADVSIGPMCCVICQDADRRVVLLPCKHLVTCVACGKMNLPQCPLCRSAVEWRLTVVL